MTSNELSSSIRSVVSAMHRFLRQSNAANTYSLTEMETVGNLNRQGPLLPSQLATLAHVKGQSMSQILNKLEADGIIKRTPSDKDKRKVYVSLTATGKKMVERRAHEKDELLKDRIDQLLTAKEKEAVSKALLILKKLV